MYNYTVDFQKIASKIIYEHKELFMEYRASNRKLNAVKDLKYFTGGGLKECNRKIIKHYQL